MAVIPSAPLLAGPSSIAGGSQIIYPTTGY